MVGWSSVQGGSLSTDEIEETNMEKREEPSFHVIRSFGRRYSSPVGPRLCGSDGPVSGRRSFRFGGKGTSKRTVSGWPLGTLIGSLQSPLWVELFPRMRSTVIYLDQSYGTRPRILNDLGFLFESFSL